MTTKTTKKPTETAESEADLERKLQLSLRLEERTIAKIEKIQDVAEETVGVRPDRTEIIRRALDFGLRKFAEHYEIQIDDAEPSSELRKLVSRQVEQRHEREGGERVTKKPRKNGTRKKAA